jgi:16S rRNA (cytosine1402-N4)-methyltransferase
MSGGATSAPLHLPVLRNEVLAALKPQNGEMFVDGTFGAGGYARAILEAAECRVFALDRDPNAVVLGRSLEHEFQGRLTIRQLRFSEMESALSEDGVLAVEGVVLDIGLSSMQLDQAERGFSFVGDGPLDMRMSGEGPSAADFVNTASQEDLADVIWRYGEEPASRRIARAVVKERKLQPLQRTTQLAEIVAKAVGTKRKSGKRHPATRVFQALRIFINDELTELQLGLEAAERLLVEGGRLCVVTFHSLEDRIVKRFLIERSGGAARGSRHVPEELELDDTQKSTFSLESKRALRPSPKEIEENPRSRSARLRFGLRTAAPAWASDGTSSSIGEAS